MLENKKISIIIPTYNVEKYVFRAIESCINQTYENIEIIIIDDGSNDNTRKVIEEYYLKDKRIKKIYQDNLGVASARNKGIVNANGDYLVFLDSDDWLEIDTIEYLIKNQEEYSEYFITANFKSIYLNDRINKENEKILQLKEELKLVTSEKVLKSFLETKYRVKSACYKLFSKKILKDNNINFKEYIFHGEDGLFVFEYLLQVDKVLYSNKPLWNILERPNSTSREKKFNRKLFTAITAVEKMLELSKKNKDLEDIMKAYLVQRTIGVFIKGIEFDGVAKDEVKKLREEIKKYKKEYFLRSKTVGKIKYYTIIYFNLKILKFILKNRNYLKKLIYRDGSRNKTFSNYTNI